MQVNGALHSLEGSRVIIHHNLTQGFFLVILSVGHKMNLDETGPRPQRNRRLRCCGELELEGLIDSERSAQERERALT